MAAKRVFQVVLTMCYIGSIAAIQVTLHLNKTNVNHGERLRFTCTAPSNHKISLREIGKSPRVTVLYKNDLQKNVTDCYEEDECGSDSSSDSNHTTLITEITVTRDMHGKSFQCESHEDKMDHILYYSEGVYVTVVGVDDCTNITASVPTPSKALSTPSVPVSYSSSAPSPTPSVATTDESLPSAGSGVGLDRLQQTVLVTLTLLCTFFANYV